jgi:hypothetical protein
MHKHRTAAKVDSNQPEIVSKLKQIPGVTVELDHDDILVGCQGLTFWYEIKPPEAVSKKTGLILESKIKDDQKRIRGEYRGHYVIVSSFEQIILDMNFAFERFGLNIIRIS